MADKPDDGLVEVTVRKPDLVSNGKDDGYGRHAKGDKLRCTPEQAAALIALDVAE